MVSSFDYAHVAISSDSKSIQSSQTTDRRTVQNFLLIWLDKSIDEVHNNDSRHTIMQLHQVVNIIHTFKDVNKCVNFINDIKEEKVFVISSGALGQKIVPIIHDVPHVSAIYIFCGNKTRHEQWVKEWPKVKGVFTEISSVYKALKQITEQCDRNSVSIRFVPTSGEAFSENLDQLDQSFMYTQILKEILLTIDFKQVHIKDFLSYCREQFADNTIELQNIDRLGKEYHRDKPIWWYTFHSFLYSMLNRALRIMEVGLIIKMGFFIHDLHQHIAQLHSEQYVKKKNAAIFTVYRGQGLSQADFNQLMKTTGGLISFNNFLSASKNRKVSLGFVYETIMNSDLVGILFVIMIDPSISSTPFANIKNFSCYENEEEVLFSMHSVFRIGHIKYINTDQCLWEVNLTLASDKSDYQLHILTERIREETFPHLTGWDRLAELLIKLGQFSIAEQVCQDMLKETPTEHNKADIYHRLGMIKRNHAEYTKAITFYKRSIEIKLMISSANPSDLAASYGGLGSVYDSMSDYSNALDNYEEAHEIFQKARPFNLSHSATSFSNMGVLYTKTANYLKALSFQKTALEMREQALPSNHPHFAISYNNIGLVYNKMDDYTEALMYHEKACKIFENILPSNHPHLARCYSHIGNTYNSMGNYPAALSFHKKALEIYQETLSLSHPDSAFSHNSIGLVYRKMSNYLDALSSHTKAVEIYQKTLPSDHPDLASCYNNIAHVQHDMGDYLSALSLHQQALKIYHQKLSPNHPDLVSTHNNIGLVYEKMDDYVQAAFYYKKVIEIYEQKKPPNYFELVTSYDKIGLLCEKMGENAEAISYYLQVISSYEKAIEVFQQTRSRNRSDLGSSDERFDSVGDEMMDYVKVSPYYGEPIEICRQKVPPNHFDLASSYNKIGLLYDKMGETGRAVYHYLKAISSYEKAVEICQQAEPQNHPDLASSYNKIGLLCEKMDDNAKAIFYYIKAVEICQQAEPQNHPDLASSYNKIGLLCEKMDDNAKAVSYDEKEHASYKKAIEVFQQTRSPARPDLASSYDSNGLQGEKSGDHSGALSSYVETLMNQQALPLNHPSRTPLLNGVGLMYGKSDDRSGTLSSYERAAGIKQNILPSGGRDLFNSHSCIGMMHQNVSACSEVCLLFQRAIDTGQDALSKNRCSPEISENKDSPKKKRYRKCCSIC